MWLAALAAPISVFLLALAAVRRQRRRPLALAAPIALALTVCFEAVLLNALSVFHGVTRGSLLVSHGAVALVAAVLGVARLRAGAHLRPSSRAPSGAGALMLVLALPIAYSAIFYVPSNWDSMTYHLARVAHWLQQRSVAAFETNVARQVTYPSGAEYVLTVLQAVAGTDRLANLVQLASWMMVALAAPPLARIFGAPRRIAPWAALIFAAAPMAVLQASSTQNDLVASAVTVAVVAASLPFLHRRRRWRALDLVIAAAVLSAGVLVKPTALVVTAPFVVWAGVACSRALARDRAARRTVARGLAPAVLLAAVLLVPELARRADASDHGEFAPFLYPPLSEGSDRTVNAVRGIARHVPLPDRWTAALAGATTRGCSVPRSMCTAAAARAHEDVAGNPASALLAMALLLIGFARWPSLPVRARTTLFMLLGAWFLFSATFRDNVWISRLHLPLFALAPLTAAALAGAVPRRRWIGVATATAGLVLFAFGVRAACRNELRPFPNPVDRSFGLLPSNYYAARSDHWSSHVRAMTAIADSGCKRLGLFIGGDSYDYPLTWRAMQRGIAVHHYGRSGRVALRRLQRSRPASAISWRHLAGVAVGSRGVRARRGNRRCRADGQRALTERGLSAAPARRFAAPGRRRPAPPRGSASAPASPPRRAPSAAGPCPG